MAINKKIVVTNDSLRTLQNKLRPIIHKYFPTASMDEWKRLFVDNNKGAYQEDKDCYHFPYSAKLIKYFIISKMEFKIIKEDL